MRYMLFRIYFIPSQMQFALQQASNGVVHHVFRNSFSILFHFIRLSAPFFFLLFFFKNSALCFFLLSRWIAEWQFIQRAFLLLLSNFAGFFRSLSLYAFLPSSSSQCASPIFAHTHFLFTSQIFASLSCSFFSEPLSQCSRAHTQSRQCRLLLLLLLPLSSIFFTRFFFSLANVVFLLLPFVVVSFPSFLFFSLPTPHPLWICIWWISMQMQSESKSKNKREK